MRLNTGAGNPEGMKFLWQNNKYNLLQNREAT
jgi:hypothetical protein